MFEALLKSLPMAVAIAISPGPILVTVMLLMSHNAKKSTPAFLFGWLFGIQVIGSVIILMPGVITDHGGLSDATGTAKIILGTVLLLMIIPAYLKKRKEAGSEKRAPKMFNKLDGFSTLKIFVFGFFFSALSVKNAVLSASGAAHIHTTTLKDYTETLVAVFLFALNASFTIIIPTVLYFLMPEKMAGMLLIWRNWLIKNNWNIIITMLFLAGLMILAIGINVHMA